MKHRRVFNVTRTLRFQANLLLKFWGECAPIAIHLINRTPSRVLKGKTSYKVLYEHKPSYDHICVIRSLSFAQIHSKGKEKFASRSRKYIFVGHPLRKKGWKLYDLDT